MNSSPTVSTTAEPLTSAIGIDMRYGIVAFSLFGLAIASTGCSRDAVDVDFSADAGRAIRFEGRCGDATRAVPGDPADGKVIGGVCSCMMCKKMVINAGIEKVIIRENANEYSVYEISGWIVDDDSLSGKFGY